MPKVELRKIKAPFNKIDWSESLPKIVNTENRLISEHCQKENEIFETALRTTAKPPIKGEITKRKITWRGIRICHQTKSMGWYRWLEQRGKQISPKVTMSIKLGT